KTAVTVQGQAANKKDSPPEAGGIFRSDDRGATWTHLNSLCPRPFYYGQIRVDPTDDQRVYVLGINLHVSSDGGKTFNTGKGGGAVATPREEGSTMADWKRVGGGDGFYCQVDPTDANTVYCEMQYGGLRRVDLGATNTKGGGKGIKPAPPKGDPAYRFNWSSPLLLSPHNPKTLYYGGNFLFRTTTRGDAWDKISSDLTRGKPGITSTGNTISTIAE